MTPQELKNSILQLAIQGRLVEQRPEEGTAAELYAQIQREKQALIKAGKLKREKPLPEITEDEKPFDIPESWSWVRLGALANINGGYAFKSTDYSLNGVRIVRISDFNEYGFVDNKIVRHLFTEEFEPFLLKEKNILLCMTGGTVGKSYFVKKLDEKMMVNQRVATIKIRTVLPEYINYNIIGPLIQTIILHSKNSTNDNISIETIRLFPIPLPPSAEQKRIVARIEELLPLVDRYEQAWNRLEDLNKRFPGDLQKSLLQLAIQGKLVEQRPEEGTGEDLYQQIQREKQALIKAGKLKKEKPLQEITEEEIPFDIPESWKWARIGQVFNLQAGKNKTSSDIYEESSPEHKYRCYGGNGCRGYVADYNRSGYYALIGRQGALCGNIQFAEGEFYATEHAVVVEQFADTDVLWCGYFLKALNLNQYATATAQPGLAVTNISQVLIPLPPVREQKRIVSKLKELWLYCEKLK